MSLHPLLEAIASRLLRGETPLASREEAEALGQLPRSLNPDLFALAGLARARFAKPVFTCAIVNAKSGRCPEDCAFCAQSARHRTDAPVYPLADADTLFRKAEAAAACGAARFGIVTSGTALSDRDLDSLCASAEALRARIDIALCGSLGMLNRERARRLRQAGFTSYHHNLETARSHFPAICTTHAYEEDLASLACARAEGLRVCSCGIFGLGESWAQRAELLETLAEAHVDSLAVNFLMPVPGTRLEGRPQLEAWEALRCVALARLTNPARDVVVCGGRLATLGAVDSWVLAAGANGLMTGDYLTTRGSGFESDQRMLQSLGLR